MSWYSDRELFNEFDPSYCKNYKGGNSKAQCNRCAAHERDEEGADNEVD